MVERHANLWTTPAHFRVITTNGSVRADGCAVLGRGCAREAAMTFPRLRRLLGARLQSHGNHVHFFDGELLGSPFGLFTFPVKHQWNERADLGLIAQSVDEFRALLLDSATYAMPRPGCGNGGLLWAQVGPIVATLPDNVVIVHF